MAISQVQNTAVSATSSPALAWTTTTNNLLLVTARSPGAQTMATPSGWTLIATATIGSGTRNCYLFGKLAAGSTSDRQSFVATAGTWIIEGFEFASGGGTWSFGTTQNTNWSLGQNSVGTGITATGLTTASTNPALIFYVGFSQASTASSISNTVGSGGANPDTPTGSDTLTLAAWQSTTSATAVNAIYSDSGANNRTIFQFTASVTSTTGNYNAFLVF